jgi:hypothetical protein
LCGTGNLRQTYVAGTAAPQPLYIFKTGIALRIPQSSRQEHDAPVHTCNQFQKTFSPMI